MSRTAQPEGQLCDGLFGEKFVDGDAQLVAPEAGQLGEQRGRVDFDDEAAAAPADDLAVISKLRSEKLVEGFGVGAASRAASGLTQDVLQELIGSLRFRQVDARFWVERSGESVLEGVTEGIKRR